MDTATETSAQRLTTAVERIDAALTGPGFARSIDGNWIAYTDGCDATQIVEYHKVLGAELFHPVDLEAGRGWVYGDDGAVWVDAATVPPWVDGVLNFAYLDAIADGAIDFDDFAATRPTTTGD